MHSYFSAKNQPYAYYNYSLFVAEVASTFNEQLLSQYLLAHAKDKQERAYPAEPADRRHPQHDLPPDDVRRVREADPRLGRVGRTADARPPQGASTTACCKLYFGPDFTLDPELDLECLRVPHFYRAFYVYKYATGMSAAMALVDRVTGGGPQELERLSQLPQGRLLERPARPAARRRRRHGKAATASTTP